jgi:hypothetical protein
MTANLEYGDHLLDYLCFLVPCFETAKRAETRNPDGVIPKKHVLGGKVIASACIRRVGASKCMKHRTKRMPAIIGNLDSLNEQAQTRRR